VNNLWVILASILSSGVVASIISASLTDAKEKRILRRQKVEEIYLGAAAWLTTAEIHFLRYLRVCEGSLSYNQVLDMEIAHGASAGDHHLRMRMNIEMYEHRLIPALRVVEKELELMNRLRSAIRNCYDETGQASELTDTYREQLLRFGKAGDALKGAIIDRGSEIGRELGPIASIFVKPPPPETTGADAG
jgi:hypothetical protein